jgi:hypothetical protein
MSCGDILELKVHLVLAETIKENGARGRAMSRDISSSTKR